MGNLLITPQWMRFAFEVLLFKFLYQKASRAQRDSSRKDDDVDNIGVGL